VDGWESVERGCRSLTRILHGRRTTVHRANPTRPPNARSPATTHTHHLHPLPARRPAAGLLLAGHLVLVANGWRRHLLQVQQTTASGRAGGTTGDAAHRYGDALSAAHAKGTGSSATVGGATAARVSGAAEATPAGLAAAASSFGIHDLSDDDNDLGAGAGTGGRRDAGSGGRGGRAHVTKAAGTV
jgi:hypothetical protein